MDTAHTNTKHTQNTTMVKQIAEIGNATRHRTRRLSYFLAANYIFPYEFGISEFGSCEFGIRETGHPSSAEETLFSKNRRKRSNLFVKALKSDRISSWLIKSVPSLRCFIFYFASLPLEGALIAKRLENCAANLEVWIQIEARVKRHINVHLLDVTRQIKSTVCTKNVPKTKNVSKFCR